MVVWERDWKSLICFADPHSVPAALNRTQYMLVNIAVYLHTCVCIDMYTNICINAYVFSSEGIKNPVLFF